MHVNRLNLITFHVALIYVPFLYNAIDN